MRTEVTAGHDSDLMGNVDSCQDTTNTLTSRYAYLAGDCAAVGRLAPQHVADDPAHGAAGDGLAA